MARGLLDDRARHQLGGAGGGEEVLDLGAEVGGEVGAGHVDLLAGARDRDGEVVALGAVRLGPIAVRLKIHWAGESTTAVNGSSITGRSYQRCTFTIGDDPEAGVGGQGVRGRPRAPGPGGRASTTPSAASRSPSLSVTAPGSTDATPRPSSDPAAARLQLAAAPPGRRAG